MGKATTATCPKTEPWKEASGLPEGLHSISVPNAVHSLERSRRDHTVGKNTLIIIRGGPRCRVQT